MKKNEIEILGIKKNKRTYTVHTSLDKYIFQEESILKYQLFTGAIFSQAEWKEILKQEGKHQFLSKALNYLSFAKRSKGEISKYLQEKGAVFSQIHFVLEKLSEIGYIDDAKLAQDLVQTYAVEKLYGPKLIEQKLTEKHFSPKDIENALSNYDAEQISSNISSIVEKELRKNKQYPVKKQQQKLFEKCYRMGYDAQDLYEKLANITFEDESYPKLMKDCKKAVEKYQTKQLSAAELKQKVIQNLLQKGYDYSSILQAFVDIEEDILI